MNTASSRGVILDDTYHYPPELLTLLTDAISLVCRAKRDVALFFRGAGVRSPLLDSWNQRLAIDRESVRKHEIARSILCELNEQGDGALRLRREVVKRIVEIEDFSGCWESDALKARGLVAAVRDIVQAKDTVTRINLERTREREEHQKIRAASLAAKQKVLAERETIKRDFFTLFGEPDPHRRGRALEGVLNRLFRNYDILVREAFTLVGETGQGVVEQIDGAIEFDGHLYLVEMKWWHQPLGPAHTAQHIVRVYNRGEARGLLISNSSFTPAVISQHQEGLQKKVLLLCELRELVDILDRERDLVELLRLKQRAAIAEKRPFTAPYAHA